MSSKVSAKLTGRAPHRKFLQFYDERRLILVTQKMSHYQSLRKKSLKLRYINPNENKAFLKNRVFLK